MRSKKNMISLFTLLAFLIMSPYQVIAQQTETAAPEKKSKRKHPREEYSPDVRPDENYLARFQAIDVSEKLIKENLENIYTLKVIVSNFKNQGWEGDYQKIYDSYKKGVSLYYRRYVIYARVELEKNKKSISDLFKNIVAFYEDETHSMLENCANKILDFSLDERNKFDPNRNRVLFQNMMRLWIAYGQTEDSERSAVDRLYKTAVFHLRIAKSYAIAILEQLDPQNSIGKYKVHKADNLNRIQTEVTAKAGTETKTAPQ